MSNWLPPEETERARTSGLGGVTPLGNDALRIRFEQAVDLAQVARWIEQSYDYAPTSNRTCSPLETYHFTYKERDSVKHQEQRLARSRYEAPESLQEALQQRGLRNTKQQKSHRYFLQL